MSLPSSPSSESHEEHGAVVSDQRQADERMPLIPSPRRHHEEDGPDATETLREHRVPKRLARRLYVSHFLSTWNSRIFEFGAVLYLATTFPGTLLPMSIYAFTRGISAVLFAPAVGQYIDSGERLQVVRLSIIVQRLAVAASCVLFFLLGRIVNMDPRGKNGMLALLAFLACVEKLCSIMNLVSVEKDWVVVIADKDPEATRVINAQMRRIDLLCKLLGPLFIALIDGISTEIAIIVNFATNLVSIVIEYFAIARVYHEVPALQEPKHKHRANTSTNRETRETDSRLAHNMWHVKMVITKSAADFGFYFHHRAFLPSIGGALLWLTVLTFGGQMVTYLLAAGYNSNVIGIARTLSVACEVAATWVAPWLMGRIGPVRSGLWMSSCQVMPLVAGVAVFWQFYSQNSVVSASGLVIGTIISRLGLIGFDLSVQIIVQQEVEAENRGAFSSVEAAFQSLSELLSYASTMIFARPSQFKWPTLISVIAVVTASTAYTTFTRKRRGHLVHLDLLSKCLGTGLGKQRERDRGFERIASHGNV